PSSAALLPYTTLFRSVDGRRRAEDHTAHVGGGQRAQQRGRAGDVVVVVGQRLRDRLADRLQAGEVDHRVEAMLSKDRGQRRFVPDRKSTRLNSSHVKI